MQFVQRLNLKLLTLPVLLIGLLFLPKFHQQSYQRYEQSINILSTMLSTLQTLYFLRFKALINFSTTTITTTTIYNNNDDSSSLCLKLPTYQHSYVDINRQTKHLNALTVSVMN